MTPKVTAEKKKLILDTIVSAAETLFGNKGYHGTSMDDIVKESGYSKGAIYGHFESKEQLFLAVLDRQTGASLEAMRSQFSPDDSAWTKLEKILKAETDNMSRISDEECRLSFEIQLQISRQKSWRSKMEEQFDRALRFIAEIVEEGIQTGEFEQDIDPESVAAILVGASNGLSLYRLVTSKPFDWKKINDTLCAILHRGVVATSK
ncbi:MAG: TetR/AcrR family transcriptional regulator [Candidatus Thorarchaeota archaeon]